jgi:hypothetical protein
VSDCYYTTRLDSALVGEIDPSSARQVWLRSFPCKLYENEGTRHRRGWGSMAVAARHVTAASSVEIGEPAGLVAGSKQAPGHIFAVARASRDARFYARTGVLVLSTGGWTWRCMTQCEGEAWPP